MSGGVCRRSGEVELGSLGVSGVVCGPVALRLGFHLCEAGVVSGELVQVGPRDLAGCGFVVIADVRRWVASPVLEFDLQPDAEQLNVEPRVWSVWVAGVGAAR